MKRKRIIYSAIIIILIFLFCSWQYQKYMSNKISMSEKLQEIDNIIKKENSKIFKIVVYDVIEDEFYRIQDIEKFTSIFDNLKGTTLNTNKKGIKTDYDYSLYIHFGKYESDVEYTENGRINLYLYVNNKDGFEYSVVGGSSKIEFNGRLEKNSNSFVNPFIEYVIEGIESNEFIKDVN